MSTLVVSLPSQAVPLIDNGPQSGTASYFGPSAGGVQTYGNVFRVSSPETVLNQFTFTLQTIGTPFTVKAYVARFDQVTQLSGPVLFTSAQFDIIEDRFPVPYAVNTGGLALADNTTYVAFFSSLSPAQTGSQLLAEWATSVTPYTGDNRLVYNTANSLATIPSTLWQNQGVTSVFTATFSTPVPEIHPATAGLPLTVSFLLLAVAGSGRRRVRPEG